MISVYMPICRLPFSAGHYKIGFYVKNTLGEGARLANAVDFAENMNILHEFDLWQHRTEKGARFLGHIDGSSFNRWGDSLQAGAEVVSNLPVSKDQ